MSGSSGAGPRAAPPPAPVLWRAWSPLWRARRDPLAWYGGLLLVQLVVAAGGYTLVAHANAWRGRTLWSPRTALDGALPFTPQWIWVYATLYLYFPLALLCARTDDAGRRELLVVNQGQLVACCASWVLFLAFPCEVERASLAFEEAGAWTRAAFAVLHAIDPPWNAWPSLHVSITALVCAAIARWRGRWTVALTGPAWAALCASTLFIRQHFAFDVATGALLGALVWSGYVAPRLRRST